MEDYLTPTEDPYKVITETVFTWLRYREPLTECRLDLATGEWFNIKDVVDYVNAYSEGLSKEEKEQYLIDLKSL